MRCGAVSSGRAAVLRAGLRSRFQTCSRLSGESGAAMKRGRLYE